MPLKCSLVHENGQVISTAQIEGSIPDALYPKVMSTGWMVTFEQPSSGWTQGRYHATCGAGDKSIGGWFDVEGI
jgi:hypothetical protein